MFLYCKKGKTFCITDSYVKPYLVLVGGKLKLFLAL